MTNEELQQKIEDGELVTTQEGLAYRNVFNALKKEPYLLPSNFADQVMLRLKTEPSSLVKEYFWLGMGLLSFIVAAGVSVYLIDFKFTWGAWRFMSDYSGIVVLAVVLIGIIQWLDKKLMKPSYF